MSKQLLRFRPQVGQRIRGWPVDTWNDICDYVGRPERQGIVDPYRDPIPGATQVMIKNDSGGDVGRGGVLKIDGLALEPAGVDDSTYLKEPVLSGTTPADASDNVVICPKPIGDGLIRAAVIKGAVFASVNVTDASHAYAVPASGDTEKLVSHATSGFAILWKESGTGTKNAVVDVDHRAGAANSEGALPVMEVSPLTYNNNDGFLNGRRYVTAEGGFKYEIGTHGISWNASGYWETSLPGVYLIVHKVEAVVPVAGWEPNCDPSGSINVAKAIRRQHVCGIKGLTSVGGETFERRHTMEHTNFQVATYVDAEQTAYQMRADVIANINTGDKVYAYIEGYQWPVPGDMIEWPTQLSRMVFVRLNDPKV